MMATDPYRQREIVDFVTSIKQRMNIQNFRELCTKCKKVERNICYRVCEECSKNCGCPNPCKHCLACELCARHCPTCGACSHNFKASWCWPCETCCGCDGNQNLCLGGCEKCMCYGTDAHFGDAYQLTVIGFDAHVIQGNLVCKECLPKVYKPYFLGMLEFHKNIPAPIGKYIYEYLYTV
jgi:hypothetical protein